ncbi:PREDICTED: uncharacterized protein LOC106109570 [Papilio polytes]|uniref:uncharacterized protein LOC106109570 n=1 Tax=Papilio polytes TaxID=76194 RepID=UPI0006767B4C|nr:PREDICTED: uncharacterized protein LOC106109570 [Papilio polytes]
MPLKRTPPKSPNVSTLDVHPLQTHSQSDPAICMTYKPETLTTKNTQRIRRKRDRSADQSDLDDFKNTIMNVLKDLQTTVSEIKEQNVKLQESVDFTAHKYDEILTKMKEMEEERKEDKFNKNNSNNKLNTEHLQIKGPKIPIYFSENLSTKTKRLYYLAREFAAYEKYKFCWTTHGKVYLRKEEGTPLYRINSEEDINKLKLEK